MPATVLLVEDDALFRETVRDALTSAGYEVYEAEDGISAVEQVQQRHPDLVLLDFDLPRMMGDEALSQMLQLRPGLICYVLSGKDDLNQALLMGRRGAYGWIDKYVGTERLLALTAEGVKTRPAGVDLHRLVSTSYPQPVAAPFIKWHRLDAQAAFAERLAALREIFESLVEYVGVVYLAHYLNQGLYDDELNAQLWQALEQPSCREWVAALESLLPTYRDQPRAGWWRELAIRLLQPASCGEAVGAAIGAIADQAAVPRGAGNCSIMDLLRAMAAYHPMWLTPQRLLPAEASALAQSLGQALSHTVAELAILCDLELCWVEQATLTAEGDFAVQLDALTGLAVRSRTLTSPTPLRQGELYLVARGAGQPITPLGPMMTYGRCELPGLVSHGIFTLTQVATEQRALYLSHTCGHVRWVDSPATLDAIRRLYFNLNPRGTRYGHLLREVAVALVDLSGYTQLTREHGPAVARQLVRSMVSAVREAARQRGGTLGEAVGDEVLVFFDDPKHALLAIVETMHTLEQISSRHRPAPVRVHVGMDYGPGIVESNDVWGDVINRAKRCQSVARANEIVVSAQLAESLKQTGDIADQLEPVTEDLKGFGPAEVYRVAWKEMQDSE